MLFGILPITVLEVICEIIFNSKDIVKSTNNPNENSLSIDDLNCPMYMH